VRNVSAAAWPTEIRVPRERDAVKVTFADGSAASLPAEYLRVFTPSAERTGHGARNVIGGKRGVRIAAITPVGNYAVRIAFDDGHDTGIYPLASLRALADGAQENWRDYLDELARTGLSRDAPGVAPAPRSASGQP